MDTKEKNSASERDDASDLSIVAEREQRAAHPTLIEQDIADRKQYRQLRQYAFFGVAGIIATLTIWFVVWTGSFGMRLFYSTYQADPGTSGLLLTPIIVIAALVAVPLLALIRFVFRESSRIEDDKNDLTIWQLLVKELSDVLKTYLGRIKTAA